MKRILLIIPAVFCIGILFSTQPPAVQDASADPGASEYCAFLAENFSSYFDAVYDNHGECVSRHQICPPESKGNTAAVCYCKMGNGLLWGELGQCVKVLRAQGF